MYRETEHTGGVLVEHSRRRKSRLEQKMGKVDSDEMRTHTCGSCVFTKLSESFWELGMEHLWKGKESNPWIF